MELFVSSWLFFCIVDVGLLGLEGGGGEGGGGALHWYICDKYSSDLNLVFVVVCFFVWFSSFSTTRRAVWWYMFMCLADCEASLISFLYIFTALVQPVLSSLLHSTGNLNLTMLCLQCVWQWAQWHETWMVWSCWLRSSSLPGCTSWIQWFLHFTSGMRYGNCTVTRFTGVSVCVCGHAVKRQIVFVLMFFVLFCFAFVTGDHVWHYCFVSLYSN